MADTAPEAPPEPDATPAPEQAPEPETPEADLQDPGKKALDAERKARREAEKRFKEQAAELEQFRLAAMSDTEKAVEIARQQARAEVLAEVGGELVAQAVRAAVAGRGVDPDALLEGLDPARFLNADGRPDTDAIEAWVERIAPKPQNGGFPDLGQGARNVPLGGDALARLLERSINPR